MKGLERLGESMHYIEEHLDRKIEAEELASICCMSKFHFLRMFQMVTDMTLTSYIRNRRLTIAARELLHPNVKVIDIALKFGYETPESFAKAFRKMHGISPSEVKKTQNPNRITAFPPLTFQITVKGEGKMNYQIVEKPAFNVMGTGLKVSTRDGDNFKEVPAFWKEVNNGKVGQLLEDLKSDTGVFGICMEFAPEQEEFTYFVAVEKGEHVVPDGFVVKEIPASTWAVFHVVGAMPDAIQHTIKRIYAEWFPGTGYQHAGTAELEVYPPQRGKHSQEDYQTEIWIPIIK
ncbi:AraC family transcriptional regulator [Paraliobacillus quinghaiensis]|uniref:AraC family transcriptional regulator n=1 Tax=Paraliobacillus quinghaiensis TaxID=470815 RepID=A0A917TR25_9BACI|nr:AraC family transcriptional regulator [Paraliobacillus quinghaiensis]GGM33481.1 AraC family transcriptional regulator [Paraliobacillus quinghaiensis]